MDVRAIGAAFRLLLLLGVVVLAVFVLLNVLDAAFGVKRTTDKVDGFFDFGWLPSVASADYWWGGSDV